MLKSSQLSSTSITFDHISHLRPSVMFPFFHPNELSTDSHGQIINQHIPDSVPTVYNTSDTRLFAEPNIGHSSGRSSSINQSCFCQSDANLQASQSSTIALLSFNAHQSVIVPLPAPARLFEPTLTNKSSMSDKSMIHTCYRCGRSVCFEPGYLYSNGTTQADTAVHTNNTIEKTLYTWTQLVRTSVLHCSSLFNHHNEAITEHVDGSERTLKMHSSAPRLCQHDRLALCPGHVGTAISYTIRVQQWQEPMSVTSKQPMQPSFLHVHHDKPQADIQYPYCDAEEDGYMSDAASYNSTDSESDDIIDM